MHLADLHEGLPTHKKRAGARAGDPLEKAERVMQQLFAACGSGRIARGVIYRQTPLGERTTGSQR